MSPFQERMRQAAQRVQLKRRSKKRHKSLNSKALKNRSRHGRVAIALALSSMFPSIAAKAQSRNRAMWVWQSDNAINNVSGARDALFSFCATPPGANSANAIAGSARSINVLYLYAHAFVNGSSTQKSNLRSFLRDAHARGIKVEFLDGAADWATTGKSYGESFIQYALQFNAAGASSTEKFDGIQLDVEPYLLPDWFTQATWDSFMGLLNDSKGLITKSGQSLPLGVAIPRWYDSNPGAAYLMQVQSSVDYVAVMDYVDNAASLANDISTELQNAKTLGKKVVLGVETIQLTPTSSSFFEEGWGNMEGRLYDVNRRFVSETALDAIATHHYTTYAALSQWGSGGKDLTAPVVADRSYVPTGTGGYFNIRIIDVCGGAIDATGSTINAKVIDKKTGLAVLGTWATSATPGYVTFTPTLPIDASGNYAVSMSPKDVAGNVRTDSTSISVVGRVAALSPLSAAVGITSAPTLKWSRVAGATSYRVQVTTDSTYGSNIVIDKANLTDSTLVIGPLSNGVKYFWRVSATNTESTSRYSALTSFTVGTATLLADASGPLPLVDSTATTSTTPTTTKKRRR